jgi:hypothetical protein
MVTGDWSLAMHFGPSNSRVGVLLIIYLSPITGNWYKKTAKSFKTYKQINAMLDEILTSAD